MYFDIHNYLAALRFAWAQTHWRRRRRTLALLLLWVPVRTLLHSFFFLLDYLLFPRLWFQRVEAPVFIVGLPRAGSTLLEQILSSHSQVDGTLELPNVLSLSQRLRRAGQKDKGDGYPGVLARLPIDEFAKFGRE